jgi:hypothetical protein
MRLFRLTKSVLEYLESLVSILTPYSRIQLRYVSHIFPMISPLKPHQQGREERVRQKTYANTKYMSFCVERKNVRRYETRLAGFTVNARGRRLEVRNMKRPRQLKGDNAGKVDVCTTSGGRKRTGEGVCFDSKTHHAYHYENSESSSNDTHT